MDLWYGFVHRFEKRSNWVFLTKGNVTGEAYRGNLRFFAISELGEVPENNTFQQHGASMTFSVLVHQNLFQEYLNCWTGKAGLILWSPPLPDFDALLLLLMGILERYFIYCEPLNTIPDLKSKITHAVAIDEYIMEKSLQNMENCSCSVLREGGGRFEHIPNCLCVHVLTHPTSQKYNTLCLLRTKYCFNILYNISSNEI